MINLKRNIKSGVLFIPLVWKAETVYISSVWVNIFIEILGLILVYYFWKAIYLGQSSIQGFTVTETVRLMVLARIFSVLLTNSNALNYVGLSYFGRLVREGELAIELLRPVDLQWVSYIKSLGKLSFELSLRIPLIVVAVVFFEIRFPLSIAPWSKFLITAFLGYTVLYLFDWALSCLAFFTTATWGLNMVRWGIATFLGGALIPLEWLPVEISIIARHSPFGQALAIPLRVLLENTPNEAWSTIVLEQLMWIGILAVLSRFVYNQAQKVVTIAGG